MTHLPFEEIHKQSIEMVAKAMLLAAKTAPKGKGKDNLSYTFITGNDIERLSQKTEEIGKSCENPTFLRDSKNILSASAIILLGTKFSPLGLKKCGLCGFGSCEGKSKHPETPCVFNTGDLGIAIGSAVSIAADHRVDNRIMYTSGIAAIELGFLDKDTKIAYGIPLSASAKNPFFDRQ